MVNEFYGVKKIKIKVHPKAFTISATSFNCSSLLQKLTAKFSIPNTSTPDENIFSTGSVNEHILHVCNFYKVKLKLLQFSIEEYADTFLNRLLTFSLPFFTTMYRHSWKNFFVHFSEKTNLLLRSDNNTGFSIQKSLQTTTI